MDSKDNKEDKREETISVYQTLSEVDFTGITKFESNEEFSAFLLNTFEKNNIKVYNDEDKIQIQDELGKGAFGVVYKAVMGKDTLAIKFLDTIDHTGEFKATVNTILNELKAITKINHPKIPYFYGVYVNDGKLGLMFSFIKGETLNKYLETNKSKLTRLDKLNLVIQLVEILICLHDKRVVHRDVKPKNTMVTPEGDLILIDFGISKISDKTVAKTSGVNGSPAYCPAEAFVDTEESEERIFEITTKFDVWSVGCVLMEVFSDVKPWSQKFKDSNRIIFSLSKKQDHKGYGVPLPKNFEKEYPELLNILKKTVCFNVKDRFTSKQLLDELFILREKYECEK